MIPHPFRSAIEGALETGRIEGVLELCSPEVVFSSPVVFKPYQGREALGMILGAVMRVFEDFRYEREIGADGAEDHALVFKARVGDRELQGCDFIHTGPDGLIDEFTVMVRPRSAMLALAEAMASEMLSLERELEAEAPA